MAKKSTSKLFQDEVKEEVTEKEMNLPEEDATESTDEVEVKSEAEEEPEEKPIQERLHDKGVVLAKTSVPEDSDIQDIDLSVIQKKRFRINGDNNKILELNTSDMRIATRLKESYPRLNALMDSVADKFSNIPDDDDFDEEALTKVADAVDEIDRKMRA